MAKKIKKLSKKYYKKVIALGLILAMAMTYVTIDPAKADGLTIIKDTLDDSRPGASVTSKHTIIFTSTTAVAAGETVAIGFANNWTIPTNFVAADVSYTGATIVGTAVTDCTAAASEMYVTSSNTDGSKNVTLTVCTSDSVAAGAITMVIGAATTKIGNPSKSASVGTADIYTITIGGTQTNSGNTKVAIIEGVAVTATVDTSLSFTIAAVASTETVNGATTNITTTVGATITVPFGTVAVGTNKIGAHDLTVSTNASGGYTITTEYTAALTNESSDTITNETGTNASPDAIDANEVFGYTTNDATLSGTADRFTSAGGNKWAGFSTTGAEIAYDAGPVSSQTTRAGYQMGVSGTTEAGNYSTTIIFIATPTY